MHTHKTTDAYSHPTAPNRSARQEKAEAGRKIVSYLELDDNYVAAPPAAAARLRARHPTQRERFPRPPTPRAKDLPHAPSAPYTPTTLRRRVGQSQRRGALQATLGARAPLQAVLPPISMLRLSARKPKRIVCKTTYPARAGCSKTASPNIRPMLCCGINCWVFNHVKPMRLNVTWTECVRLGSNSTRGRTAA